MAQKGKRRAGKIARRKKRVEKKAQQKSYVPEREPKTDGAQDSEAPSVGAIIFGG